MTSSARTGSPRRSRRNPAQLIVGALILLGVIASVLLVFSDSVELLRVGVVAAAWAAIVGAIAMTKYRRESAVDRAKARDLQTVYQLQLEREISARREFELGVEARVRREVGADAEELVGLRTELVALRRSLEMLFEGDLLVDRVALRADSTRIAELAAPAADLHAPAPAYGDESNRPQFATPFDDPVTAETSTVDVGDAANRNGEAVPQRHPEQKPAGAEESEIEAETEAEETPTDDAGTDETGATDTASGEPESAETEAEAVPLPEPAPGSRRRRRAADEDESGSHNSGLSVAQIMANLRAEGDGEAVAQRSRSRDN